MGIQQQQHDPDSALRQQQRREYDQALQ